MRLARFQSGSRVGVGVLDETAKILAGIARRSDGIDLMIAELNSLLGGNAPKLDGSEFAMSDIRLLPPIQQPSKNILCIGKNYREHAAEFARSGFDASMKDASDIVPSAPIIFSKAPCTMIGAHDVIEPPWDITNKVDYEGELGVIIGQGGRSIARADAHTHIWGYTVLNDVTARDLQASHKQWLLGKSIDTFCPIGPHLVSADEVDPGDLELKCWVNDELRQSANTRDLIFDVPAIIEAVSASMTLSTGDIIATGTPAGVGIGFDPPRFLRPGDRVKVAIEGIGSIENTVR